jgi:hypothetical protein
MSFTLPFLILPEEFIHLLKSNHITALPSIIDTIHANKALCHILEGAFKEFNTQKGVEGILNSLGIENFRDRVASIYIYKSIYGTYPNQTNLDLVEGIKNFEGRFQNYSIHGHGRLFLLGFYLELANLKIQHELGERAQELSIPNSIEECLKLSQGRSHLIDLQILLLTHFSLALGEQEVLERLKRKEGFDIFYQHLSSGARDQMAKNMLAYGASIQAPDIFLYEKV